jgi:phenylalanyl-tRNA synthetase beta chain
MRLVLSWVREFVDIDAAPREIAGILSLRGFEVASVESLPAGDAVIDFEITANRPDCLSVLGLAREIATAFERPLYLPSYDASAPVHLMQLTTGRSERLSISIEDEELCPRYAGAFAEIKIGPSPSWMVVRLQAAGVRPISNIVDITNYVNLELGQPLHAFDYDRLMGGAIRVRRAVPGEQIRTLDGVERRLDAQTLVIADRDRAQAIAGVMGGADSEVSKATTAAVFESAYFKATAVRRASKVLGLKTEASARFERGADISAQVTAIERVAALISQLDAGRIVGPVVDCYPHERRPRTLHLRRTRLARLLGAAVPDEQVVRILRSLSLAPQASGDGWDVTVPLFRVDITREADLIEEVGRHYGFDRLDPTFPVVPAPAPPPDPRVGRDQLVRRIMTSAGLTEAVTFGFIEARTAEMFAVDDMRAPVAVANPLSGKFDTLRPLVLPGLVDAVAHNRRHGRRDVRVFEVGTCFAASGETRSVAAAWTGTATPEHWSTPAREVDFYDAKGTIEQLCAALGVDIRMTPVSEPFLSTGQAAAIVVADGPMAGERIGFVGRLAPAVVESRDLPRQDAVIVAELDLDAAERACVAQSDATQPLPRFPSVVRDLSIVVANTLPAEIIRGTILTAARGAAAPLVATIFFDRYTGKGVPEAAVSISVRLTFQAADRTLTDAEVQQSFDAILAALVREHGAVQR